MVESLFKMEYFKSACATLSGIEVMHTIYKGRAGTSDAVSEIKMINRLFGVA